MLSEHNAAVKPLRASYSNLGQTGQTRSIEVLHIEPGPAPGELAICSVRVGGIVISQVRVINRGRGTFINYPSRKVDGVWVDLVQIRSQALRNAVDDQILAAVAGMDGTR